MRLSELKTGEKAVVVKVLGHGGFRKRIVEMGFIKGKTVEVLLNAPLQDPVKYKILGYEISLRRDEAQMIEVVSEEEAKSIDNHNTDAQELDYTPSLITEAGYMPVKTGDEATNSEDKMQKVARHKRRIINVALVGNPNCGKTSLFNFASGAHEKVGNYSGVTVDAKEGVAHFEGYEFHLVDLPGTYSLSAYSPEELYVRKQIIEKTPDVVINVLDASNLERNLYLTTQLVDMNLRMVCALNMYDEFEKRGDSVDLEALGKQFGVPMIPTVFKTGRGVQLLFHIIINMYEGVDFLDKDGNINPEVAAELQRWHENYQGDVPKEHQEDFATADARPHNKVSRHIHINHGPRLELCINRLKLQIEQNPEVRHKFHTRYLAIKLLENDADTEREVAQLSNIKTIIETRENEVQSIQKQLNQDCETAIMDAKYAFIHGALAKANYKEGKENDTYKLTHKLDAIITHKFWGFPIFFFLLYVMFQVTFTVGQYPMDWIDQSVNWLGEWVNSNFADGAVKDLLVEGIIAGVGAVVVFLPQILILYFFISFMEDSGYMARAAFIMDKLMHKMGLHGKSFIPLIMGFGCNVPAVMATRTIESRRSRLITMLILPMMSCSARLPIYIMITGTFFALKYRSAIMISMYVVGILMAVIMSKIFSRFLVKGEDTPFVMELPPYRFPTKKAIARHTWEKGKQYLQKMGGIILVASIIVWAVGYFPHNDALDKQQQQEQSIIGRVGKTIEPLFRVQGFDWKLDVSLLAGVGAKEIVASTMGVLYADDNSFGDDDSFSDDTEKYTRLRKQMITDGISPISAYAYLIFVLLYFPCIATVAAIRNESGSWRWALFAAAYTTLLAWVASALVYQVGSLIVGS